MEEEFLKVILEKKKSNGTGMTKDEAAGEALKKRQINWKNRFEYYIRIFIFLKMQRQVLSRQEMSLFYQSATLFISLSSASEEKMLREQQSILKYY